MSPRILVFGSSGKVGGALLRSLSGLGRRWEVISPGRGSVDLGDPEATAEFVRTSAPTLVLNAAAYTAVDAAEIDRKACAAVNGAAPGALAHACKEVGAALVHFSTNFVFDGESVTPYREDDETHPLNAYGATKLEGEQRVRDALERHLIVRTALVFSREGESFVSRMLRLARERDELAIVDDQRATPTRASSLAEAVLGAVSPVLKGEQIAWGTYHVTSAGSATIHEFAERVLALDPRRDEQRCRVMRAVPSSEYPTPARRPKNGVLDCAKFSRAFGVRLPDWREELEMELRGS